MKVYCAGPMRGYPEFNFPAFDQAAKSLRDMGHKVFSPAEFDRIFCVDPAQLQPMHSYIRRDVHIIVNELDPKNKKDGLLMLPGWEKSTGALAEHALAQWCGLRIYYSVHECL